MKSSISIIFMLLILVFSSCQKRYWYRSFVWGSSKNLTPVNIVLNNSSTQLLNKTFEDEILAACKKQLQKKGFKITPKKAALTFELNIKVDKFTVSGLAYYGGQKIYLYPYYDKDVKAILLDCYLFETKKDLRWKVWENSNDLYFFGKQKRDMRRTKSMVKYLIRSAKQK
jgi:hypothetical protein